MDEFWYGLSDRKPRDVVSPLYYAALCGFYDLAERLIMKRPEQANVGGGLILAPLPAALYKRHFRVADLLRQHDAAVDVRGFRERTLLHRAAMSGHVDIVRWLLNHGADANARQNDHWTPLHLAVYNNQLEVVQVLLGYNVDTNSKNDVGETPLHLASLGQVVIARLLLSHGANVDEKDGKGKTPFQMASLYEKHEMTKLLLEHGAVAQS
ncbi:ankyrin repeat-containing domain protein [Lactarius deliciosus]|nr:ankyrin repeat-containing domain protein [Lactarius deliciosus]